MFAGKLEFLNADTDVNALIYDVLQSALLRQRSIGGMPLDKCRPECVISTDRNRVMQVILNSMTNATKFTKEGTIRLGYRMENPKFIIFYLSDTGCGLTEEEQKKIFERCVKLNPLRKEQGWGFRSVRLLWQRWAEKSCGFSCVARFCVLVCAASQ